VTQITGVYCPLSFLLRLERVDPLGAYRIQSETGLLIPSVKKGPSAPVGVGIVMARDPLRRSGQALLTHPAPTLGDNAQALERIGMTDADRGEPASEMPP
jgi:hypothetical protein